MIGFTNSFENNFAVLINQYLRSVSPLRQKRKSYNFYNKFENLLINFIGQIQTSLTSKKKFQARKLN